MDALTGCESPNTYNVFHKEIGADRPRGRRMFRGKE